MIDKIGVVGLGQIGGSLCRVAKTLGLEVIGHDVSDGACASANADGVATTDTLEDLVKTADVIFISVSIDSNRHVVHRLVELASDMDCPPTISDVASYKRGTMSSESDLPYVIPGHPMAGTQESGYASSDPQLFRQATWVLILRERTDPQRVLELTKLLNTFGAFVQVASVGWHDNGVSLVSALPHALAEVLGSVAAEADPGGARLQLAAGSFKSGTRVMRSDPNFVRDLLLLNRTTLLPYIDMAARELSELRSALESNESETLLRKLRIARALAQRAENPPLEKEKASFAAQDLGDRLLELRNTGTSIHECKQVDDNWECVLAVPQKTM